MPISVDDIRAYLTQRVGRSIDAETAAKIAGYSSYVTDSLNAVDPELLTGVEPSMAFQTQGRGTQGPGKEAK